MPGEQAPGPETAPGVGGSSKPPAKQGARWAGYQARQKMSLKMTKYQPNTAIMVALPTGDELEDCIMER